jgi:hypothetical protein
LDSSAIEEGEKEEKEEDEDRGQRRKYGAYAFTLGT